MEGLLLISIVQTLHNQTNAIIKKIRWLQNLQYTKGKSNDLPRLIVINGN